MQLKTCDMLCMQCITGTRLQDSFHRSQYPFNPLLSTSNPCNKMTSTTVHTYTGVYCTQHITDQNIISFLLTNFYCLV